VPELFTFMAEKLGMSDYDAYGTFNMGAGYAVYCAAGSGDDVVSLARDAGFDALVAGVVEEGARRVIVEPPGVTFTTEALSLR
jgi:phosphoribosylformylglycinamidine cyclo-ligase